MSNKFCSARNGRILALSLEAWKLLEELYDDDRMSLLQEQEFLKLWDIVEGEENAQEIS